MEPVLKPVRQTILPKVACWQFHLTATVALSRSKVTITKAAVVVKMVLKRQRQANKFSLVTQKVATLHWKTLSVLMPVLSLAHHSKVSKLYIAIRLITATLSTSGQHSTGKHTLARRAQTLLVSPTALTMALGKPIIAKT